MGLSAALWKLLDATQVYRSLIRVVSASSKDQLFMVTQASLHTEGFDSIT